jgi:hypothetical protein
MRALTLTLGAVVLLAGCSSGAQPAPTPAPTPSPTPSPDGFPSPASFTIDVSPPEEPPEVRAAIPGQRVCFLVTITDPAAPASPVTIGASATGAKLIGIEPVELSPGTVGEVCVVPDATSVETTAQVTITATRDGASQSVDRSLPVFPMADERFADAAPCFDRWVDWLVAEHPELGITGSTEWTPEFVSTLLVVSHYGWWSDEWEVTVLWHNMIAPHDWTEIHLRHRWTDVAPSLAFRIDSVSGETEPHAVTPPEVVVR